MGLSHFLKQFLSAFGTGTLYIATGRQVGGINCYCSRVKLDDGLCPFFLARIEHLPHTTEQYLNILQRTVY
jgi:hypothetical protein